MNTTQLKNFAIQSRRVLKEGVLNRIIALGFDIDGRLTVDRPQKIGGGTVFMEQLRDEEFYDAWIALEKRIASHGVKEVCEEAAYIWFNRLVAIRIMQKNGFIEPVMAYTNEVTRIPVIVDEARTGRLSIQMSAAQRSILNDLLMDPTKTNEQFSLLISAFCESNPVIFNCFGGIEKHISLLLPDNILAQDGFIDLLNHTSYLTDEDYKQSELIGWLYQYYISERKDEVFDGFKKGKKAEAEDIPAATQIFTPNWIVKYMVQNTLGRIYLDNNPYSSLGDGMKYLVKSDEKTPEDAILRINDMDGYTLIDPACGSGHILVEAFDLLFSMYQDEAYPVKAAITSILTKNIIGLDLDTRAKQLATFALLMKACQKDRSFLDCKVMPRVLDMPEPFVYEGGTMKDFLGHFFLGGNKKIINETEKALELMKDANTLGSIMKFDITDETREAIKKSTEQWEQQEFVNDSIKAVIPSMKVILALTDKYVSVAANPPYMGSNKFNSILSNYTNNQYYDSRSDLFAVFIDKMLSITIEKGRMGCITMESWMFLSSFEQFRKHLLDNNYIVSLSHFGWHIIGIAFGTTLTIFENNRLSVNRNGEYSYLTIDDINPSLNEPFVFPKKDNGRYAVLNQKRFYSIPRYTLGYWASDNLLSSFKKGKSIASELFCLQGIITGKTEKYIHKWFEVSAKHLSTHRNSFSDNEYWVAYTKGGIYRKWFGNNDHVLYWKDGGNYLVRNRSTNSDYYLKPCLTWTLIGAGNFSVRYCDSGFLWDVSGSIGFPKHSDGFFILAFLNSKIVDVFLDVLNPTINTNIEDVNSLPLIEPKDYSYIHNIAINNVNVARLDWDAHETSWDFKENELIRILKSDLIPHLSINGEKQPNSEELSFVLDQYKLVWADKFNQLHANEEELNRQFIEIYGLQEELTPDVPLDEITILQQGEISIENNQIVWHDDVIIKQLLSYAIGCWMGRYRLDKEGLDIAHYPTPEEICTYNYNGDKFEIDDDAIIPLMGKDTPFEDDNALQKIVNFVKMVFGEDKLTENLNFIEHCLGKSIEDYLIKDFWKDHKKMYQNRPIYWLFSSKKGAFQALVYMHRMNPYTAEKVRTKYLLPYIEHLKGKIEIDEARGFDLTTVERKNLVKMQVALEECIEYHDRLHEIAIQNIGFDLDDGVVVNYAKFGDVLAKIK